MKNRKPLAINKKLLHLLFAAIIFFCAHYCFAQVDANSFSISFLPAQSGLTQATNRFMLQDRKGYMWIGSQDGINRYNGKDFFHFEGSQYYENCKPIKNVFGLVEDINGDIWLGGIQGLYQYQQNRHAFKNYQIFDDSNEIDKISMPFAAVGNEVWVTDGDLSFKAIDCRTQKVRTLYTAPDSIRFNHFSGIVPQTDGEGNIWSAKGNIVYKINILKQSVVQFYIPLILKRYHEKATVNSLALHAASHTLAIATTNGLVLFNTQNNAAIEFGDTGKLVTGVDIWYVRSEKNCFWVSNDKCPLIKVGLHGNSVVPMVDKRQLDNDTHRGTTTAGMYLDKWGRLWLNANGEYMAIIDFKPSFMKKVSRSKDNGLRSGTVVGIASIGNELWVTDNYLTVINKLTGVVTKKLEGKNIDGMPKFFQQSFYDSLQHRIWFPIGDKIYYYDFNIASFKKAPFEFEGNSFQDKLRNIVQLKTGEMLFARNNGVFKLDKDATRGNVVNEFGQGVIHHLDELSGNRLVLSAVGSPLKVFKYDLNLHMTLIKSIDLGSVPNTVAEDTLQGNIWAGTDHGIYKIDGSSYKVLRHYTVSDGMANDFIYAVLPDKFGWVWSSTNKGIVGINTANDDVLNFDMSQNLQDLEFNNRVYTSDKDGYIYFGGVKGLNYFKPPFTDADTIQPKLVIEEISLNDTAYATHQNPDNITVIKYAYGTASLSIKVQALHLVKATSLKILYRLKGQRKDWSEINNGDKIQMFNLAIGSYQLELTYRDGSRKKQFPSRIILIEVMPPWYRTWWFLLLMAMLSALGIWYMVTSRQRQQVKKLQQENEIIKLKAGQELMIAQERERIITDLHDDVGATLSSMHIYGDLAENVWLSQPQTSKEMVGKITQQAKDLMVRMGDIIWSMKPATDEKYTLSTRLINFSNELLTPKNIICQFNIDETLIGNMRYPAARKNVLLIIKEAMNNIAKYSGARNVKVSLVRNNDLAILTISDDGKGYNAGTTKSGNGHYNIGQRCNQLQGSCIIKTKPGQGVIIECSLPISIFNNSL